MDVIIWLLLSYYILGIMGYAYIYKTNEHTLNVFGENDEDNDNDEVQLLVNI